MVFRLKLWNMLDDLVWLLVSRGMRVMDDLVFLIEDFEVNVDFMLLVDVVFMFLLFFILVVIFS